MGLLDTEHYTPSWYTSNRKLSEALETRLYNPLELKCSVLMTYLHLKVHSALVTSRGENCREKFCSPPGGSWPEVGVIVNGITSPPSLTMLPESSRWSCEGCGVRGESSGSHQ